MSAFEAGADLPELDELRQVCHSATRHVEGGDVFYLLKACVLPSGLSPRTCDVLLCSTRRDGYESRLFFSEQPTGGAARTWTQNRILERNWFTFSWQLPGGLSLRPIQQVVAHLRSLR